MGSYSQSRISLRRDRRSLDLPRSSSAGSDERDLRCRYRVPCWNVAEGLCAGRSIATTRTRRQDSAYLRPCRTLRFLSKSVLMAFGHEAVAHDHSLAVALADVL